MRNPPSKRQLIRKKENHIQPRPLRAEVAPGRVEIKGGESLLMSRASLRLAKHGSKRTVCAWLSAWVVSVRGTKDMVALGADALLCGEPMAWSYATKFQCCARAAVLCGILVTWLDGLVTTAGDNCIHRYAA